MLYAFDHIVITARDKIFPVAQRLANLGFQLTPMAKHNLGSCNQLVMLSNAYVEVLGWEEGTVPQRKEIADLPMGLDALVYRTYYATECYEKLQKSGFDVNPVQKLSRPAQVDGEEKLAQFNTV
jgi:Glyoxalase-like domain